MDGTRAEASGRRGERCGVKTEASIERTGGAGAMREMRGRLATIAQRDCTVLIWGETGVGKEVAARQIHAASRRRDKPFIPVDCTTLRETLFESQLFGHVRGAFTGAERETQGFFRAADGGVLFLDEVGELEPAMQGKLLRAIQDRAVVPLGGTQPIPVNVRIIAATNRDLAELVREGEFREDLYFRLDVVQVYVPPLRQRPDEVLPLAERFLREQSAFYEEPVKRLAADARDLLMSYDWPGNVRELANAVEHAVALCRGRTIRADNLPQSLRRARRTPERGPLEATIPPLEEAERSLVARALHAADGNKARAARLLRIERRRLYRMVRRFRLEALTRSNGHRSS